MPDLPTPPGRRPAPPAGLRDDTADLREIEALRDRLSALKQRGSDAAVTKEIGVSLQLVADDLGRLSRERLARGSVDPDTRPRL